ncbi:hypothetical protein ENSA5_32030 [Enhygromyxa salina]|uniref:DUF481 domain-containing protein n=1 Tax=Enhygromyxa salina TaxID=215803 RepID=A0A2S9XXW0_9BACT|nr:DUF481 domain-containing protein [Enhygromyxa salina]PRP97696.1 hypothetical protein ENSA5_32030 [Enhygromyxa salina]
MPSYTPTLASLAFAAALAVPSLAAAAPPEDPAVPEGTASQDNASSGSTELASGDKFSTATDIATEDASAEGEVDPHANDATEFDIALGGIFNTGNSTSLAFTGLSNFRLRRTIHQFGASLAGNYGASGSDTPPPKYDTDTGNVQGLVRYDVFFAKRWTAFVQATGRHDTFQGLDFRMNVDPGFAFYALNKTDHRLWFEAGYDFQYDLRTDAALPVVDENGDPVLDMNGEQERLDKFQLNHAVRLFAGYSNKLSERVGFDTGLEYLQSVIDPQRLRLNYLASLNTQLVERLSFAVTFTLRYENQPLPNVVKLDTITSFQLAYRFF